jgi:pyruvate dehydrogenase complex dehydrogenase (E1) component
MYSGRLKRRMWLETAQRLKYTDTRFHGERFEVDRHSIVVAALAALGDRRVSEAIGRYGIDPASAPPWKK